MTTQERIQRVEELRALGWCSGVGDRKREIAKLLGISVTRAARVIDLGVETEAAQYAKDNPPQKKSKRQNYHDHLYNKAMSLAVDVDEMDVVEHYCQGHIDRLKTFIAARTEQTIS